MYVRLLTGRYAGEERDIRADAARMMLADGRASLPVYQKPEHVTDAEPSKPSKRKKA